MNHLLQTVGMMAALDIGRESRDAHGRRRQFTAKELDALADWDWHLPDLKGAIAACVNAVRSLWQPRVGNSVSPPRLPASPSPSMSARPSVGAN